jgi:hypothetical protein
VKLAIHLNLVSGLRMRETVLLFLRVLNKIVLNKGKV